MTVSVLNISLLCIGKLKDPNLALLTSNYVSRIGHDAKFDITELKDGTKTTEAAAIMKQLGKRNGYSFALSEEGASYTSRRFARKLETINSRIIFIIGGATGIDPLVKSEAKELLSLSPFTFTHEIARLLLAEQLYRAISILRNRPYHND